MKKTNFWLMFGMSAFAAAVLIMSVVLIAGLLGAGKGAAPGTETAVNARYDLGPEAAFLRIDSPRVGDRISSPMVVTGAARTWYFEGSFPVELKDGNSVTIASGQARAQGDWMSDQMVPFSATLQFANPSTATGTLILRKDNPSGLPQNDDQVQVQVDFSP